MPDFTVVVLKLTIGLIVISLIGGFGMVAILALGDVERKHAMLVTWINKWRPTCQSLYEDLNKRLEAEHAVKDSGDLAQAYLDLHITEPLRGMKIEELEANLRKLVAFAMRGFDREEIRELAKGLADDTGSAYFPEGFVREVEALIGHQGHNGSVIIYGPATNNVIVTGITVTDHSEVNVTIKNS